MSIVDAAAKRLDESAFRNVLLAFFAAVVLGFQLVVSES
jgi:hypothetical protein